MNDETTDEMRGRMRGLSKSLLRLHKILLDAERGRYEAANGKVRSTGEMFRLVLEDSRFAWLRVLSGQIVVIDEFLGSKLPTHESDALEIVRATRSLLSFEGTDENFNRQFQQALHDNLEAAVNHNEALKLSKT
jgi:hypothetical protein